MEQSRDLWAGGKITALRENDQVPLLELQVIVLRHAVSGTPGRDDGHKIIRQELPLPQRYAIKGFPPELLFSHHGRRRTAPSKVPGNSSAHVPSRSRVPAAFGKFPARSWIPGSLEPLEHEPAGRGQALAFRPLSRIPSRIPVPAHATHQEATVTDQVYQVYAVRRPSSRIVHGSIRSIRRCVSLQGSRPSVARTASSDSASTASATR